MKIFNKYFQNRKMKALVKQVTESIYSEQFDFSGMLNNLLGQTNRLQALIAIKLAVTVDEPITKNDIEQTLEEVYLAERDLKGDEMQTFLKILEESTEVDWLQRTNSILQGKLAFSENENSYEAAIYQLEKIKKGPASQKERNKWKILSSELEQAEKNYKDYLQKKKEAEEEESKKAAQAVLDKMIEERDERRKNMTEEEIQSEIAQARENSEELIKQLKETVKLNKGKTDD